MTITVNDNLVLICGESSTGKSACLRNLENVLYLNCEAGKKLPFKPKKFIEKVITHPQQVFESFEWAEQQSEIKYIVIDGLNFLMDMFETLIINTSSDTRSAWGKYAEYFRILMQNYVAKSTKNVVFTAHTLTTYNAENMSMETKVPIKGALKNQGIEAFFSVIVSTKKIRLTDLEEYQNSLLNITDKDKRVGYKHVFQTQITADTVNERMRSPMGLFDDVETYIDNDANLLMQRLNDYYTP